MNPTLTRLFLAALLAPLWACANDYSDFAQSRVAQPRQNEIALPPTDTAVQTVLEIDDATLAANPALIRHLLNEAIDQQQTALLPDLIAMYQPFAAQDPLLLTYAQAVYAASQGKPAEAIRLYRQMLSKQPQLAKVRFKLAQALFDDKQFEAAVDQFDKLRSEALPAVVQHRLAQYQQAIRQTRQWQVKAGLSYLYDNNLNNAAATSIIQVGKLKFEKSAEDRPQKGRGVEYRLGISRAFPLAGNHALWLENQLDGKYYWNNRRYNETANTLLFGYQFENAAYRLALLPLYEYQWFGNKRYSHAYGVRIEGDRELTPKWQLSGAAEYRQTDFRTSQHRKRQFYSATIAYRLNAREALYGGADLSFDHARPSAQSHHRYGLRLGWQREWQYGISSRISGQIARKLYQTNDRLFSKKRQDWEWQAQLVLWKRNWHWFGLTPKLQYRYQQVSSNLPDFYSFDKHQLSLLVEKRF